MAAHRPRGRLDDGHLSAGDGAVQVRYEVLLLLVRLEREAIRRIRRLQACHPSSPAAGEVKEVCLQIGVATRRDFKISAKDVQRAGEVSSSPPGRLTMPAHGLEYSHIISLVWTRPLARD
jgi:hypothetical protein